jgi:hypothetical protein
MIREDRLQLNERFRTAFRMLEDRGIIVKNDRNGKGIGDVAERILGNRSYGHIVRAYLNQDSERVVSYTQARVFCREFGINESWMLDGLGSPFGIDIKRTFAAPQAEGKIGNILFTSMEAFAGTTVDAGSFATESNEFFSIPGLSGSGLVAFPVNGNSMEPLINDGDVVICREVNSFQDVRDNDIYAIKNHGSVWIKYVQKLIDKGRVTRLKLISANHLEYDPFQEEINEFTRLYRVIRKISPVN